ncbi:MULTISPECIES: hypothetical protein [Aquimarina]|uniref:DNA primase n=1 Tax=Aquimarina aggregata TaxID=1642818 RepID=A0A163A9W6_9FLAO|nr:MULTISPECIES: hypothetical protein [Aquimarina]KZS40379.1 hypothetical protein AWE51_05330 [Aquimarina aggregata]
MKRVIVDYKKLNKNILNLLVEKFPDGYNDNDIISFRNHHNEAIEAVEVKTEDTIYLVKISKRLADTMESFDDDTTDSTTEVPVAMSKDQVEDLED